METTKILTEQDLEGLTRQEYVELLELTSPWETSEDTKFHLYKPTDTSVFFHSSAAKIRAFFGGNRSSKTYSQIIDIAAQFTGVEPKSLEGMIPKHRLDPSRRIRLCMNDYPNNFTKVIWPYIQQLVPQDYIVDYIKDSGRIKAITNIKGGFVEFMQYDQQVSKFAGSSRHQVSYDEEGPEDIYDENRMRLVDTDGEETHALTPLYGTLRHLYDGIYLERGREVEKDYEFVLNDSGKLIDAIPGEMRDVTLTGGDPNIHVFFACIFDNPIIAKDAAIRILSKFPKDEQIVRGKGHLMFRGGLVYKEYNDTTHLIDSGDWWWKGQYADNYTLYVAIDPHPRTPHAVLFIVVDKYGRKYVVEELFIDCTAKDLVAGVKVKSRGKPIHTIVIDPLAYTTDPATKTSLTFSLMEEGMVDPMPIPGSKKLDHGIQVVQGALTKEKRSSEDPGSPELYIMEHCQRFRYEITRYAWDDWRKDTQNVKGEKQSPIAKDNHMMENLYRLLLIPPKWESMRPARNHGRDVHAGSMAQGRCDVAGY